MADIKKIKLGGVSYAIWANGVDASAISGQILESSIGSVPESAIKSIPESAIKSVPWSSVSGLTGTVSPATTSGFAAASAVAKAIDDQIAGVYKVMGSESWANLTAEGSKAKVNGNVYNLTAITDGAVDAHGQKLAVGDNVVYVSGGNNPGWDKLAATISLDDYATTAWTTGYINTATKTEATGLWNDVVTEYSGTKSAVSANSANWDSAYTWVTTNGDNVIGSAQSGMDAWNTLISNSSSWLKTVGTTGYVSGDGTTSSKIGLTDTASSAIDAVTGAVTTSADMAVAANTGKLAQVGAITGYIDEKIAETVAETIDITDTLSNNLSDAAKSAIPNAGAVTAYVDGGYIAKTDISYGGETGDNAYTLIIDNT